MKIPLFQALYEFSVIVLGFLSSPEYRDGVKKMAGERILGGCSRQEKMDSMWSN